jgi:hypothetical protein
MMANFRRKHERGKKTREKSSDWRYPQTEKGVAGRARASARRWITIFNTRLEQYRNDVEIQN